MDKRTTEKFFSLIQKLFSYMETKGDAYCRKYTLEQISLEIFSFQDTRFMEFCYGYASEFGANSVVAKKIFKMNYLILKIFIFLNKDIINLFKHYMILLKNMLLF